MAKVKWLARKAKLYACQDAAITLDGTTNTYKEQFLAASGSADYSAYIKDISVTPPEMEVELIHTLGETAKGFQNTFLEEKPETMAKLTATLIMQGDEVFESGMTGAAGKSGYTDYMYNTTKRKDMAYLVNFTDTVDEVSLVFKGGILKLGERKPTGIDGHWEQAIEIMCTPDDYREQFKD